jgi:alpha-D-ribose 1-methylphosphonate 5-triphosphate synthase subunit PhnH
MMAAVSPGFSHPVFQAQSAFRAVLAALSRPGIVQALGEAVEAPPPLSPGAAAIALTLCDHDTPVWLDDALRAHPSVGEWLRFHCGCPLTEQPREAAFAFATGAEDVLPFDAFNLGTTEYPDRSTTVILSVQTFDEGPNLSLMGPGIRGRATFRANPLPADMSERLARNRLLFPRGVDLLLVTATAVAGLPRSVRVVES